MNGSKPFNISVITRLSVCQLPDVNHALANVNNLLGTDLSNIVQKVSFCLQLIILLLLVTFICTHHILTKQKMDIFFLNHLLSLTLHHQGYSSFNDTPKLVKEQTKNIVTGTQVCVYVLYV